MSLYCCICRARILEADECFELSPNYDSECVCSECTDCLTELQSYAKSGNPLYKASRRELSKLLNRGKATENGMRYCERIIEKANVLFEKAQLKQTDAPPERTHGAGPKPEKPQTPSSPQPKSTPEFTLSTEDRNVGRQPIVARTIAQSSQEIAAKPEKIVCKSCGAENLPDSMFCEVCAAQLKPQKFCRFCGGKISPVTGFCEVCLRDQSGRVYHKTTDGEHLVQAAGRIGESIVSGASSAVRRLPSFNWPILGAVLIAVVLLFMSFGKMLEIPAISSLFGDDVPSKYSLLEVSKISRSIYETVSSIDSSVELGAFQAVSIVILISVIGALVFFGLSITMVFIKKKKVFTYLGYAAVIMSVLSAVLVIGIIGLNKYIESESSGWISTVFKGTALLYISLVCNALTAIFIVKSLRYHYAVNLEVSGYTEEAKALFMDMPKYKDCIQRLEGLGLAHDEESY